MGVEIAAEVSRKDADGITTAQVAFHLRRVEPAPLPLPCRSEFPDVFQIPVIFNCVCGGDIYFTSAYQICQKEAVSIKIKKKKITGFCSEPFHALSCRVGDSVY